MLVALSFLPRFSTGYLLSLPFSLVLAEMKKAVLNADRLYDLYKMR